LRGETAVIVTTTPEVQDRRIAAAGTAVKLA